MLGDMYIKNNKNNVLRIIVINVKTFCDKEKLYFFCYDQLLYIINDCENVIPRRALYAPFFGCVL